MSTRLAFSTTYHSQTNKQTEKVNRVIKDILRACYLDQGASWIEVLLLMEFASNNSYQATI